MIREQWYAVLSSREVRRGRLTAVTRMGERLLFWRSASGKPSCAFDRCIHRGVALSAGKLVRGNVQCPFHGLEYDASGACAFIPANGKAAKPADYYHLDMYPCEERHGFIWIYWGEKKDGIGEPPFFPDIDNSFFFSEFKDHWATHYSRVIENQLDVVHLPFVHHNTIGRGFRTVVNGPVVKAEGDTVQIWVYNEWDEGQTPKKANELPVPQHERQHLHFMFPNIWENYITEKLRVTAFFVPVDEENTLIYLRFYQKFMKAPILRNLIGLLGNYFNKIVERQDRRVVITQRPFRSDLKGGEKLIPGDSPIVAYRKIRDALINQGKERRQ